MPKIDKNKIKTWFITGCSSGIGYELCNKLIEKGYNVIAVSRTQPNFNAPNALCLSVDVKSYTQLNDAINKGIEKFGTIDVLVNNAGISSSMTIEEEDISLSKDIMETNYWGAFNTIKILTPLFRKKRYGSIINISSVSGLIPRAFGVSYISSKHALEGLSSCAWWELKNFCRVMTVELSFFNGTNIYRCRDDISKFDEYNKYPIAPMQIIKDKYENDITKAVLFIIDEAENEQMQRRLMLGYDIESQIQYEIDSLQNDLDLSKNRAVLCKCDNEGHKDFGLIKKPSSKTIGILNYHFENVNFGAVLTSFALNKFLNSNGYNAKNIDYIPSFPWLKEEPQNSYFDEFRRNYLPMSSHFEYGDDLSKLNNYFSTFIVGSDQVWRMQFLEKYSDKDAYFLSFADIDKKLISCAASFGVETLDLDDFSLRDLKGRLSLFSYVGVREKSALGICDTLNVKAEQIIDPVFYLDKEWDTIANLAKNKNKDKIVYYTIDDTLKSTVENFIKTNSLSLVNSSCLDITWNTSIEEWLYAIKNCKMFITDSYHGSCFAILFNKPFICINPNIKTSTRMSSLFEDLGIKNRLFSSFDDVDFKLILDSEIDYDCVNRRLKEQSQRSQEYLINAIETPVDIEYKKEKYALYSQEREKYVKLNYKKLKAKYYKYKILSKVLFGRRRSRYAQKRALLKIEINALKRIMNK